MAKKEVVEELKDGDFLIEDIPMTSGSLLDLDINEGFSNEVSVFKEPPSRRAPKEEYRPSSEVVSCLRNERVIVRHVP